MISKRWIFSLLFVVGLFLATYGVAWVQAYQLSETYFNDAEATYLKGKYLDALTGYKEFDTRQNKYVQHGGYLQVEHIWISQYAWPRPAVYLRAQERIQEVIGQRLTIPMAQSFIQANIGKDSPYLGIIFLRLGELYEQSGDKPSAIDAYQTVVDSFAFDPDLVAQGRDHLARLVQPPVTPTP